VEESGQCFVDAGMSPDYPEAIHRRLLRYLSRIKIVFEPVLFAVMDYADLIINLTKEHEFSVTELNLLCYKRGYNPVLFSRINILALQDNKSNGPLSLNPPFLQPP